jgi:chemotaxis response regulator CheB
MFDKQHESDIKESIPYQDKAVLRKKNRNLYKLVPVRLPVDRWDQFRKGADDLGIGASAGGLEALIQLLEKMPSDTGAGFVVVQHLAPTKDSTMPEILGRRTSIPVKQISDNTRIEHNTIYINPPEKNMAITKGTLQLLDQVEITGGVRHPIDYFFRSLARDRGPGAIGVILSGTGTDGTDRILLAIEDVTDQPQIEQLFKNKGRKKEDGG